MTTIADTEKTVSFDGRFTLTGDVAIKLQDALEARKKKDLRTTTGNTIAAILLEYFEITVK